MLKPALPKLDPVVKEISLNLCNHFNLHNFKGGELVTEGQLVIFATIVFRFHNLVEIICATQYGKSLWVALAALVVSCIQGKLIAIVAPSDEKAKIIMRYYIEHLGDNALFYSQLEKNTKLERLRQEESKERIVLRNGGGVFVLSVQQRNILKSIEAAMGAGAEIVIVDEACLITDDTEATIYRMGAGKTIKGKSDFFYCKIGNPFYSAAPHLHFKNDWENPKVFKIFIDYLMALAEGRYTNDYIENAKRKPLFDILCECEFPDEGVMDNEGYQQLILSDQIKYNTQAKEKIKEMIERERELKRLIAEESIKSAVIDRNDQKITDWQKELKLIPRTKLAGDIGGGGDYNSFAIRKGKFGFIAAKNRSKDTMTNVNEVERLQKEFDVLDADINIDDIGIGRGVTDRLKELGHSINGVSWGDSARDKETFYNLKAELFWETMLWIRDGGEVDNDPGFMQLTWIKYKKHTGEKRVQIEPKEKMRRRTRQSSDFADSFALTFYQPDFIGF